MLRLLLLTGILVAPWAAGFLFIPMLCVAVFALPLMWLYKGVNNAWFRLRYRKYL